jgi:hypothetical protein
MHLDSHAIEVVDCILLVRDALQERRLVVFHQRLAARRPAVAVDEVEVLREYAAHERDVAANHCRFDPLLEREHIGGVACLRWLA